MKRFHLHLHVQDLSQSINFYNKLFAATPARHEADYAKWMLEDPPVNFAISTRGKATGIDHIGFQTDNAEELAELKARADAADLVAFDTGATTCCYARSEKHWITDPQGIAWEHFHTLGNIPVFHEEASEKIDGTAVVSPATAAVIAASCGAGPTAATPSRGKPLGIAVKAANTCC
jgi:catechol 2,3-dioxygenase-like lactoylglutathione lyase family enzyme